jgi:neutral ceramidase
MRRRRWLRIGAGSILGLGLLFVVVVGPWPTASGDFEAAPYYQGALAAIRESAARTSVSRAPARLHAGWGRVRIDPPPGTPLAGFSARKGRPSEGSHDELWIKAVAVGDGVDVAVLIGADLLLIPPEVAQSVLRRLEGELPLTADDLLFTASHTHSGPGSLAPGVAAEDSFGAYDPRLPQLLTEACVRAVTSAYRDLRPARMARAEARASDLIRNRTREGPVDDEIGVLLLQQEGGRRCVVFGFSAHPTILGASNMRFSGDYPGYAQRLIEATADTTAVFLGGAVGSMSGRVPDAAVKRIAEAGGDARDPFIRSQALGEEIGRRALRAIENPTWTTDADVASVGIGFDLPPLQWRPLSPRWRVSSVLTRTLGLPSRGWMSMVRVGDAVFVALPGDFSGEISVQWKVWAAARGYDLWCSSFSGAYAGYISPDAYYAQWAAANGRPAYETALMSWCGPRQEAFFGALMRHMFEALTPSPAPGAGATSSGTSEPAGTATARPGSS